MNRLRRALLAKSIMDDASATSRKSPSLATAASGSATTDSYRHSRTRGLNTLMCPQHCSNASVYPRANRGSEEHIALNAGERNACMLQLSNTSHGWRTHKM